MPDLTRILDAAHKGDRQAAAELLPLVYDELRKLAAAKMAVEAPGHTLNATSLVHEAYMRLLASPGRESEEDEQQWEHRGHFFAAAATAMRRILIERARRKRRKVHGGDRKRIELAPDLVAAPEAEDQLLALDEALAKLNECDPEKARLVELRYFAGLSGDQAAKVMGISPSTADRHWVFARAWLRREIQGIGSSENK